MVGINSNSSATRRNNNHKFTTVTLLKILILALFLCIFLLTYLLVFQFPTNDKLANNASPSLPKAELIEPQVAIVAPQKVKPTPPPQVSQNEDQCTKEYESIMSKKTQGLTNEDFLRSRAWVGNEQRLAKFVKKLEASKEPVHVFVAGGSITLGHGILPFSGRYSDRLDKWLNDMFPLQGKKTNKHKHTVYNRGSHGADMCAMAKRMDMNFGQLVGVEPDLVILEFAVNDYQGQDHKIHLDHKTDVFFDGFQEKATCAEAVVHNLIYKYPNTAIMFLEFQTGILNRKTAQLLHMGVAQQYQIPVISYAETMIPGYYALIEKLKDHQFSAPIGDSVAPYPHGCAPCLAEHIVPTFRDKGCKSVCTFLQRSGMVPKDIDCTKPPAGREPCMPPFWAHDAVHPSFAGHGIAMDLIANAIALTRQKLCRGETPSEHILPPPSINFLGSDNQLISLTDWIMVKDTMDVFGGKDPLKSTNHSKGFVLFGDQFAEREGWIATSDEGGEYIEFEVDLPKGGCYILYIASLKSYEGMGTYTVSMKDYTTGSSFQMDVDGIWKPQISVPADIAIQPTGKDKKGGGQCTGKCKVTVVTHPKVPNRKANKVKIMTISARKCRAGEQ